MDQFKRLGGYPRRPYNPTDLGRCPQCGTHGEIKGGVMNLINEAERYDEAGDCVHSDHIQYCGKVNDATYTCLKCHDSWDVEHPEIVVDRARYQRLRDALTTLLAWETIQGGWESTCWREARRVMEEIRQRETYTPDGD